MSSACEGDGHCSWPNYAPNSLNDVNNIILQGHCTSFPKD